MEIETKLFDEPKPFTMYTIYQRDKGDKSYVYTVEVDAIGVTVFNGVIKRYETERYTRYPFLRRDDDPIDADNTLRHFNDKPNLVYFESGAYYSEEKGYSGGFDANTNATFVLEGTKEETYEKAMQLYQKALDAREACIMESVGYYIQAGKKASKSFENSLGYTSLTGNIILGVVTRIGNRKLDYKGYGINTEIDEIQKNDAYYKQIEEKFGEYFKNKYSDYEYLEQTFKKYSNHSLAEAFFYLIEDKRREKARGIMPGSDVFNKVTELKLDYEEQKEKARAFTQLEAAFAIYGTEEAPREHFTSEEAYDIYRRIAPEFKEVVVNSDLKTMVDAAVRWSEMSLPLFSRDSMLDNIRRDERAIDDVPKEMLSDDNFVAKAVAVNPRVLDITDSFAVINTDTDSKDYHPFLKMFLEDNMMQKTVEELGKMLEDGIPVAKENAEYLIATLNELCSESELAEMNISMQLLKYKIAEPQVVTAETDPEIAEDDQEQAEPDSVLDAIREDEWAIKDAPTELLKDNDFIAKAIAVNPLVLDVYETVRIDDDVSDNIYPLWGLFLEGDMMQKTAEELVRMLEDGIPGARENAEYLIHKLDNVKQIFHDDELKKINFTIQTLECVASEPQVVTIEDEPGIAEDKNDKKSKKGGNVGEDR